MAAAFPASIRTSGGRHVPDSIARQVGEIGSVALWLRHRGAIGIMDPEIMLGVLDQLVDDITRLRSGIVRLAP